MSGLLLVSDVVFAFTDLTNTTELPYYDPVATWEAGNSKAGGLTKAVFASVTCYRDGVYSESFSDLMYNNIWLLPRQFDFGMILEDEAYSIYIWNSYRSSKTLNSVIYNEGLGYTIEVGTVPQTFLMTQERKYALYLYKKGVSTLNDSAKFSFDMIDLILPVSGSRLLSIPDLCKSSAITIPYSFTNVSVATQKHVEERRLLIDSIKRKISITVMLNDIVSKSYLDNTVRYGQDKIFGVPVLVEQMTVNGSGSLQALQTIIVNEDISKYYNMQNCSLIGVYDKIQGIFEIAKIVTVDIATKKITLGAPIKNNFLVGNTVVYPVIGMYIENYSAKNATRDMVEYTMTFREA